MCDCTCTCKYPCQYTRDTVLRYAQCACQLTTVLSGFATTLGMGWASTVYDYYCPLYANITLEYSALLKTVFIIDGPTVWGQKSICEYTTFVPAVAAIYASIWFWFYILLSRWSKSEEEEQEKQQQHVEKQSKRLKVPPLPYSTVPRRQLVIKKKQRGPPDMQLLMPTLLFNVILWACVVASLTLIDNGFRAWCNGIQLYLTDKSCSYTGQVKWINYKSGHMTYHYIVWGLVGNWFLVLSILGTIIIVAVRLYDLFQVINNNKSKRAPPPPDTKPEQQPTTIWHDSSQSYSNPVFDIAEQSADNGFVFVDVHTKDDRKEVKSVVWEDEVLGESLKNAVAGQKDARGSLKSANQAGGDLKDAKQAGGDLKDSEEKKDTGDRFKDVTDAGDGLKDTKHMRTEDEDTTTADTVPHQADTVPDKHDSFEIPDTSAQEQKKPDSTTGESEQLSLIQGSSVPKSYQSMS